MKKPIGKFGTALIIIATIVLAGIAIYTAYRLYALRQQPVAPNVPSSQPKAEFTSRPTSEIRRGGCSVSFTISGTPTPTPALGLNCTAKTAWKDDSRNAAGVYYLTNKITAGSDIVPGQKFVYTLSYKNTGDAAVNSASFTDVLPTQVTFLDADNGCTYNSSTRTVACNLGNVAIGGASQRAIRVQLSSSAASGSLINKASLQATGVDTSECQISLNIPSSNSPTPTVTSTPNPTSTPAPTSTSTTSPTSTPGPTSTTVAKTATPAPTEAALPVSGTSWPTFAGIGFGIFIVIGAILLAL